MFIFKHNLIKKQLALKLDLANPSGSSNAV